MKLEALQFSPMKNEHGKDALLRIQQMKCGGISVSVMDTDKKSLYFNCVERTFKERYAQKVFTSGSDDWGAYNLCFYFNEPTKTPTTVVGKIKLYHHYSNDPILEFLVDHDDYNWLLRVLES